ncbi:MAG: hypothetical protein IJT88_00165 [Kiritimatiellae bacterium]|nr:hypothetical protein [Kiritimatiellia bacterium]
MAGRWKKTKFLLGLLLLPVCAALTLTFCRVVTVLAEAPSRLPWLHVAATVAGAAIWLLVWFLLPRMTRTYVLGHELTHALWTLFFGGRPSDLKVTSSGGSVRVTRNNVWVSLAPYFFPFYTILVLLVWLVVRAIWPIARPYAPIALFWMGLTWAFHLTFTFHYLRGGQPDVYEHGRLFSYALIYLLNLALLVVTLVAVSAWSFRGAAVDFLQHLADFLRAADTFRQWLLTRLPT